MSVVLDDATTQRLLDELVYERVRLHVNLAEIEWLEADIANALESVLREGDDAPADTVAKALVDRAWTRIEDEWRTLRGGGCMLCPRGEHAHEVRP